MFEIIDNVIDLIELKAHEKNLELVVSYDKNITKNFYGDSLRISQILTNLIGNAVKFTEYGEIGIYIKKVSHDKFRFEITDTGIGLTQEHQKKLFQSFSQADGSTTRKYGGTGLGLSISKQLVELMGGQIWVESEIGKGSKFIFEINLEAKEQNKSFNMFSNKKVLIVDDNKSWHEILTNILEMFDMQVEHAYSGQEALDKTNSCKNFYDIILMDWNMPELDGIATTKLMHEECSIETMKVPTVIMVSSFRQESIVKLAQDVGIEMFLQKPINPSILHDILSGLFLETIEKKHIFKEKENSLKNSLKSLGGSKILLVEDNRTNQEIILGLLQNSNITIDIANNGKESVEKYKENEYELILMDIQMPIMDGFEATKLIRELDSEIPIIALTANAMKEDIHKSKQAGMNEHLNKHIDIEKLYKTLLKYISKKIEETVSAPIVEVDIEIPIFENINVELGLSHLAWNKRLYLKILNDFRNNYHSLELEKMDDEEFSRTIHTIKGLSANIGASSLSDIAKQIEETLDRDTLDEFYNSLNRLMEELDLKLKVIKEAEVKSETHEVSQNERDELFIELKEAVSTKKPKKCKLVFEKIDACILNAEDDSFVELIKELIKKFDFKAAIALLEDK